MIRPLARLVLLVDCAATESVSEGGIALPARANQAGQQMIVKCPGPEATQVRPGDRVVVSQYSGHPVDPVHGDRLVLMNEQDIICVVEGE
jgi:co-chaperonin GroES (HSP10)